MGIVKRTSVTTNSFYYIRNQLEKNAFFETQIGPKKKPWPRQPILWQVFHDFNKNQNNLDKTLINLEFIFIKQFYQIF